MIAQKNIRLDLQRPSPVQIIHAKQGEAYTRAIDIELYNDGAAWTPPTGAHYKVSYRKPDGTGGTYDTITQGCSTLTAVSASGNILSVSLAPQVLTCAGLVTCEVHISTSATATDVLSTFSFLADVQASAESGITSEDYWNMAKNEKVVLLNAAISETANAAQTFDPALFILTPNLSDKVLGTNGYVGTVTAANTSTVTVRATGEQWLGGGGDVTKDYVDDLVKLGYLNKTDEYRGQTTYDNEDEFLRSLGAGRYYVCGDGTSVWTAETYQAGNELFSTVRNYNEYAEEDCYVYLDDQECLRVNRDNHGVYTFNKGDIGFFNNATLYAKTPHNDYGNNPNVVANKEYVDGRVKNGYIDMTTAAIYDGVESYEGVADYLMSLGAGRWAFNSAWEQHVEDWEYAVFVECIAYAQCKHWTVRQFDDEGTQYIQMYEQYGDNERNKVLDIESTCGGPFYGFKLGGMTIDNVRITHMTNNPLSATTKQYVDDAIAAVASVDYIDKTDEFTAKVASDGQAAALNWIRTLSSGKYKFTANIYGAARVELHLLDNIDVPFEMDGQTYYQRHCTEQVYDTNGNRGVIMFAGGNEVYKLFHNGGTSIGAVQGLSGTIKDYVNSRIPAKYGSEGLVLTLKEDSTAEWKELLPAYSSADAGKVLKVAQDGTLYWGTDNKGGITAESGTMI